MYFFPFLFQTLMLRDWWICTVMSITFEILEYTLEHQLPNFSECWWDHVSKIIVNVLLVVLVFYRLILKKSYKHIKLFLIIKLFS